MNKTKVFETAWQFSRSFGWCFSKALTQAWLYYRLKKQLTSRIVHFYFQKVDGSIREAYGTLKESLLPPTNGEKRNYRFCQTFFDTEINDWRSFKTMNLVSFE
ncbi:MAG: SH3 beta-barrel fold-containing protein [Marinilabiliaceae bacterium]|nr:SH3 beta-barrel fold-containing protein [Marinilabiliaceae bacterium]